MMKIEDEASKQELSRRCRSVGLSKREKEGRLPRRCAWRIGRERVTRLIVLPQVRSIASRCSQDRSNRRLSTFDNPSHFKCVKRLKAPPSGVRTALSREHPGSCFKRLGRKGRAFGTIAWPQKPEAFRFKASGFFYCTQRTIVI